MGAINRPLLLCQSSIDGWEQDIRKGYPSMSRGRIKFDRVLQRIRGRLFVYGDKDPSRALRMAREEHSS